MAKSRFADAQEMIIKREIDRINRQIRQAFTKLGAESRLAQQYATLLQGSVNKVDPDSLLSRMTLDRRTGETKPLIRLTDQGIPQISTGKAAIGEFRNITEMQKKLKLLGKQQTVQAAQKAMIESYKKRTGQDVKTRAEQRAAVESEVKRYLSTQEIFNNQLLELYKIRERRGGVELRAIEDVRKLSKGRWTSDTELRAMQALVEKAIREDGGDAAASSEDVFAKNQW